MPAPDWMVDGPVTAAWLNWLETTIPVSFWPMELPPEPVTSILPVVLETVLDCTYTPKLRPLFASPVAGVVLPLPPEPVMLMVPAAVLSVLKLISTP